MSKYGKGLNKELVEAVISGDIDTTFTTSDIKIICLINRMGCACNLFECYSCKMQAQKITATPTRSI